MVQLENDRVQGFHCAGLDAEVVVLLLEDSVDERLEPLLVAHMLTHCSSLLDSTLLWSDFGLLGALGYLSLGNRFLDRCSTH